MADPVLDFDPTRRTNARAIADLAKLGILRLDQRITDMTVGPEAGFWTEWRPDQLVTNDLDLEVEADYHFDARFMPDQWQADVMVWDPPYANRGTSRLGMDKRFGLGEYRTRSEVEGLLVQGAQQAFQVAKQWALIKCQDANVSKKYAPQTFLVWEAAQLMGARLAGELYVYSRMEQPEGKRQVNIWTATSTLMVFDTRKVPR